MRDLAISLGPAEVRSGLNRQRQAENLILQLPKDHDGRNSWLLNYGVSHEAVLLRRLWSRRQARMGRDVSLAFLDATQSAEVISNV